MVSSAVARDIKVLVILNSPPGWAVVPGSRPSVVLPPILRNTSTFDYVEKLAAIGLPLDKVAEALAWIADHHVATVQALIDLYRSEIWQPFTDAGIPSERWHSIADKTSQLRPLAIGLGIQAFRRAIDDVVGKVAAEEAAKLDRQSPS